MSWSWKAHLVCGHTLLGSSLVPFSTPYAIGDYTYCGLCRHDERIERTTGCGAA